MFEAQVTDQSIELLLTSLGLKEEAMVVSIKSYGIRICCELFLVFKGSKIWLFVRTLPLLSMWLRLDRQE